MGVERKEDEIDIWQWGERINFWEIDLWFVNGRHRSCNLVVLLEFVKTSLEKWRSYFVLLWHAFVLSRWRYRRPRHSGYPISDCDRNCLLIDAKVFHVSLFSIFYYLLLSQTGVAFSLQFTHQVIWNLKIV
jgi:hypothetical protein